jgi:signal transduction histidine kinase
VKETVELFQTLFRQKELNLTLVNPTNQKIYADRNMLNTILRNFVSNAIKYTTIGGNIILETKINGDIFNLTVSDTGVGIESENINLLLHSSESITTVGTNGENGTGLGLKLCKEFIHMHNGELNIHSEIGKGSVFGFEIPVVYKGNI